MDTVGEFVRAVGEAGFPFPRAPISPDSGRSAACGNSPTVSVATHGPSPEAWRSLRSARPPPVHSRTRRGRRSRARHFWKNRLQCRYAFLFNARRLYLHSSSPVKINNDVFFHRSKHVVDEDGPLVCDVACMKAWVIRIIHMQSLTRTKGPFPMFHDHRSRLPTRRALHPQIARLGVASIAVTALTQSNLAEHSAYAERPGRRQARPGRRQARPGRRQGRRRPPRGPGNRRRRGRECSGVIVGRSLDARGPAPPTKSDRVTRRRSRNGGANRVGVYRHRGPMIRSKSLSGVVFRTSRPAFDLSRLTRIGGTPPTGGCRRGVITRSPLPSTENGAG